MSSTAVTAKIRTLIAIATSETTGLEEARTAAMTAVKLIQTYNIVISLPHSENFRTEYAGRWPEQPTPQPQPQPEPPRSPPPRPTAPKPTVPSRSKPRVRPADGYDDPHLNDIAQDIYREKQARAKASTKRSGEPATEEEDFNKKHTKSDGEFGFATSISFCDGCGKVISVGDVVYKFYNGKNKHKTCV